MKVSVVIPVLNERETLPVMIAALRACRGVADSATSQKIASTMIASPIASSPITASKSGIARIIISEIIISDGGSTDGTTDWVRAQPDLLLVNSARGKGPQLNAGAAQATGDVLLFLHADCAISQAALNALQSVLSNADAAGFPPPTAKVLGGAFHLRFAEARPRSLRFVAWGINLRARLRGSATGDQGIFVRREAFQSIGGAPDWPLFEDVELVARIKRAGKYVVLKTPLTVSGRRYIEHGVFRTALLIYGLRFAYWLGVPPQRLKNWFRDARGKQKGLK
jgi:rSAM/selenodomain-associated transferase 2